MSQLSLASEPSTFAHVYLIQQLKPFSFHLQYLKLFDMIFREWKIKKFDLLLMPFLILIQDSKLFEIYKSGNLFES